MKTIDFRSDTVTLPTQEMRSAMALAEVGDDVYQDDPSILKLEAYAAQLVDKEAALFIPSGTMGNQLAIMAHTQRGEELITGRRNHIVTHEVGAIALLSGVNVWPIDHPNDYLCAEAILNAIHSDDIHEPKTSLLCFENALSNGQVMPLDIMKASYDLAKSHGLNVHLDGARLFNAATYLKVDVKELTHLSDSVMFCLSKGLASPVGSILAGSNVFIQKARKYRKLLGGGMRQAGILAAAGMLSLTTMVDRLEIDHIHAQYLATQLIHHRLACVNLEKTQINMVFAQFTDPKYCTPDCVNYLKNLGIKVNPSSNSIYRFVTHHGIDQTDIDTLIQALLKF